MLLFKPWNYEAYPSDDVRRARCAEILMDLAAGTLDKVESSLDTRPTHARMFAGMHDPGDERYVGNYRGTDLPDVRIYNVYIGMDPRVGVDYSVVHSQMTSFAAQVERLYQADLYTAATGNPNRALIVRVGQACAALVEFLRIHPFPDGNGHMGRFIVWAFLLQFGIVPKNWPLNDKVPQPYYTLLSMFRDGNRVPLIQFVLDRVLRNPRAPAVP